MNLALRQLISSLHGLHAHMNSIEGFDKPSKEILAKLGHKVINKAIANILETLTISCPSAKHVNPLLHKPTPSWKNEHKTLEEWVEKEMDL